MNLPRMTHSGNKLCSVKFIHMQWALTNIQIKIKGFGLIVVLSQAIGILDAQKRSEQFGVSIWTIMSYDMLGIPVRVDSLKPQS